MYRDSVGVPQDFYQAMEWFLKATGDDQGGRGLAEAAIAGMYSKGQGVFQDQVAALDWYRKAVEQGNQGALENVRALKREIEKEAKRSKKFPIKFWKD
ncbi:hypothetical protein BGX23_003354 [Mortierella sp. AD031]|nr:hypothetical protein BGX23_003354 [Mortierella sp. AD031]